MALDITILNELVIDESNGTGIDDATTNDDLADESGVPAALTALGTPIEVAYQANFIKVTAGANETVTGVVLSAPGGGPIPLGGVPTTLKTIDGDAITLFQGANGVVEGRTAGGDLAFAVLLVNNKDLYVAQYIALDHPDTGNPDDQVDLAGYISASVTATQTSTFASSNAPPGVGDFYLLNSAQSGSSQLLVTGFINGDNARPNVSTQGFGIGQQSINPTDTLQVDFVTGGTAGVGSSTEIAYCSHLDNITTAGFTINQITPSNPDRRVDFTIQALDVQGNEQGSNYYDGSPSTARTIDSVTVVQNGVTSVFTSDGTKDGITVTGLGTTTVKLANVDNVAVVDFTTTAQFDRLLIKGVDANEGMDVTEIRYKTTNTNAHSEDVGAGINFDDDDPKITVTGEVPTLTVDESDLDTTGSNPSGTEETDSADFAGAFSVGYGTDGAGSTTYGLLITGGDGTNSRLETTNGDDIKLYEEDDTIVGRTDGGVVAFKISLLGSTVTLVQYVAIKHPNTATNDEPISMAADLVKLVATAADHEGDSVSESVSISDKLNFEDDGPEISVVGGVGELTVDESDLDSTGSNPSGTQETASTDVSGVFSSIYGADQAGSIALSLEVVDGTDSGLQLSGTGEAILLYKDGNTVVGRTATNTIAFVVSLEGSDLKLEQFAALKHDDLTSND
jgi:hypothetical protein